MGAGKIFGALAGIAVIAGGSWGWLTASGWSPPKYEPKDCKISEVTMMRSEAAVVCADGTYVQGYDYHDIPVKGMTIEVYGFGGGWEFQPPESDREPAQVFYSIIILAGIIVAGVSMVDNKH